MVSWRGGQDSDGNPKVAHVVCKRRHDREFNHDGHWACVSGVCYGFETESGELCFDCVDCVNKNAGRSHYATEALDVPKSCMMRPKVEGIGMEDMESKLAKESALPRSLYRVAA